VLQQLRAGIDAFDTRTMQACELVGADPAYCIIQIKTEMPASPKKALRSKPLSFKTTSNSPVTRVSSSKILRTDKKDLPKLKVSLDLGH